MDLSIIEQIGLALVAILVWLLTLGTAFVVRKIKHDYARAVVGRLSSLARLVVRELWQTTIEAAKASSENGKLDKETAAQAKTAALAKLKSYLGPRGLKALAWVAGFGGDESLDEYLGGAIEAAITEEKKSAVSTVTNIAVSPGSPAHVGLA